MNNFYFIFFILFLNLVIFVNLNKISIYLNLFDKPNSRKLHKQPIPAIGGIIFFLNFFIFILFDIYNQFQTYDIYLNFMDLRSKILFLILSFAIFLVGLKDDYKESNPYTKIFLFFLLIYIFFLNDKSFINSLSFQSIPYVISLRDLNLIFTVLCVAAFMNAFNMFDGVNNQSSIYILVISIYFLMISKNLIFFFSIFIPTLVFGIKNYKNEVFLGNNGSYFVSFILSVYLVKFYNFYPDMLKVELVICILSVPILDMIRLFIVRLKSQKSPLVADRLHIHHLLLKRFGIFKTNIFIFLNLVLPMLLYYFFKQQLYSLLFSICIYLTLLFFSNSKLSRKKDNNYN